ncbi:formate dehydrogenase [Pelomyxa schiedti]|nr:formate dehydrogenase [Pelomyxa schiedti]
MGCGSSVVVVKNASIVSKPITRHHHTGRDGPAPNKHHHNAETTGVQTRPPRHKTVKGEYSTPHLRRWAETSCKAVSPSCASAPTSSGGPGAPAANSGDATRPTGAKGPEPPDNGAGEDVVTRPASPAVAAADDTGPGALVRALSLPPQSVAKATAVAKTEASAIGRNKASQRSSTSLHPTTSVRIGGHSTVRVMYEVYAHSARSLPSRPTSVLMDVTCTIQFPGVVEIHKTPSCECMGDPTWNHRFVVRGNLGPLTIGLVEEDLSSEPQMIGKVHVAPDFPFYKKEFPIELKRPMASSAEAPVICLSAGVIPDFWNIKQRVTSNMSITAEDSTRSFYVRISSSSYVLGIKMGSSHPLQMALYNTSSNWRTHCAQFKFHTNFHYSFTHNHHEYHSENVSIFTSFGTTAMDNITLFSPLDKLHVTLSARELVKSKSLGELVSAIGVPLAHLCNPTSWHSAKSAVLSDLNDFAYVPVDSYAMLRIPLHHRHSNTNTDDNYSLTSSQKMPPSTLVLLLLTEFWEKGYMIDLRSEFTERKHTVYDQPHAVCGKDVMEAVAIKDTRWETQPNAVTVEIWKPQNIHTFSVNDLIPWTL